MGMVKKLSVFLMVVIVATTTMRMVSCSEEAQSPAAEPPVDVGVGELMILESQFLGIDLNKCWKSVLKTKGCTINTARMFLSWMPSISPECCEVILGIDAHCPAITPILFDLLKMACRD